MEKRIAELEESMRLVLSGMFQIRKTQERQFHKLMEGFKAIERAFKLNCNKQLEFNEMLEDFSSILPGETVLQV